jgi:hypothetical protein
VAGCFHNEFLVPLGSICYQLELEVDGVLEGGICMPYKWVDGESWLQSSLEVLLLIDLIWKGGKGSDEQSSQVLQGDQQ